MTDTITTIRKSIYLATDAETVWAHLTQPDLLAKWFHPAKEPLTQGAPYTLVSQKDGDRMCWGNVLEMRPFSYMKWDFTVGPLGGQMTTVEWQIEPAPGGVRLSLEHTGLPEDAEAFGLILALDKGWEEHMAGLRPSVAEAA